MSSAATTDAPHDNTVGLFSWTLDPARSKGGIFHRVVAMGDEDARECPSQGAGETARGGFFLQGLDERRGHQGMGLSPATSHRSCRSFLNSRVMGLRRQPTNTFRERRDCNSFDTHDSADSDDESITQYALLPIRHAKKPVQAVEMFHPPTVFLHSRTKDVAAAAVDANGSKRKTPSPVVGNENSMDTEGGHTLETQESDDTTEAGYDSDERMLLSPGRRVSLSPVSRRLAIQFDSISFLSPVKPTRAKRRKTIDTAFRCL